jgi:hypothetical protein
MQRPLKFKSDVICYSLPEEIHENLFTWITKAHTSKISTNVRTEDANKDKTDLRTH